MNLDARKGALRTEIIDAATGRAIPGYKLGDNLTQKAAVLAGKNNTSLPIRWQEKKDISELLGREVMIRFTLDNAHLYSFWFDD